MARAWVALMKRLGYTQFVAQGGDWGAIVTDVMAAQGHPELIGIHSNMGARFRLTYRRRSPPPGCRPPACPTRKSRAFQKLQTSLRPACTTRSRWPTRPQTLYGIADSPVGLAAWLTDLGDGACQAGGADHRGAAHAHERPTAGPTHAVTTCSTTSRCTG